MLDEHGNVIVSKVFETDHRFITDSVLTNEVKNSIYFIESNDNIRLK